MNLLRRLLFIVLVFGLTVSTVFAASTERGGRVLKVYDGDTIEVDRFGTVRLLGIDAPEREASERDDYYLRRGISAARLRQTAADARGFLQRQAAGKRVVLELDRDERDRHGRLLAYVYLADGRLLNRLLLEQGLAAVYRRFSFRLKGDFVNAEQQARRQGLGIWAEHAKEKP